MSSFAEFGWFLFASFFFYKTPFFVFVDYLVLGAFKIELRLPYFDFERFFCNRDGLSYDYILLKLSCFYLEKLVKGSSV